MTSCSPSVQHSLSLILVFNCLINPFSIKVPKFCSYSATRLKWVCICKTNTMLGDTDTLLPSRSSNLHILRDYIHQKYSYAQHSTTIFATLYTVSPVSFCASILSINVIKFSYFSRVPLDEKIINTSGICPTIRYHDS